MESSNQEGENFSTDSDSKLGSYAQLFSDEQLSLFQVLSQKNVAMGEIYAGAILVLEQETNPFRISMAAYALRELLSRSPRYFDVEIPTDVPKLPDEVKLLEKQWQGTCKESSCYKKGIWEGEIDKPLRNFLKNLVSFFMRFEGNNPYPYRREIYRKLIRNLDRAGLPTARPFEEDAIAFLNRQKRYLNEILHGGQVDETEFCGCLQSITHFLSERLVPKTFVEIDDIRKTIAEGEANGH